MLQTLDQQSGKMGLLGYGWLIQHNYIEIAHGFGIFIRMGMTGSNVAEYFALIEGLEALADLRIRNETIEIRGDAKCVIDQMTGSASVRSHLTRKLNRRAQKIMRRLTALTWVWVPRRKNKQADALSRRGLRYLDFTSSHKRKLDKTQPVCFCGAVQKVGQPFLISHFEPIFAGSCGCWV